MEHHLIRKDIKKCETITYHSDFLLFSGKKIHSCSKHGGPLATYPEVKPFLHEIARLPNGKLLVDDGNGVQHILDLSKGIVLMSQKMTKKRMCPSRFAISTDNCSAFRVWCWGEKWDLLKMNLSDLSYQIYDYPASLRFVGDIIVTSANEILVLESQIENDGTCTNQVSSVSLENSYCSVTPIYQWTGNRVGKYFDGRYVLESQYWIRDLKTGDCFTLLENSDISLPDNHRALSHIYDSENNCLQLIDHKQTWFIDCGKREIIARYRRDTREPSFIGTRVGNEFWFGKNDGIYASSFPVIEDI